MSATHDRQRDPDSVRAYMHFNDRGLLIEELRECARIVRDLCHDLTGEGDWRHFEDTADQLLCNVRVIVEYGNLLAATHCRTCGLPFLHGPSQCPDCQRAFGDSSPSCKCDHEE
jgi:hypothetical protein